MSSTIATSETIFNLKDDFWSTYQKGRPQPPDSFYQRILDYHAQHGGHFDTIHDVGAGPGVLTPKISQPFSNILMSDIVSSNVKTAKSRLEVSLESSGNGKSVEFHTAPAEDASWIAQGSVDLIMAGTFMHLVDLEKAMEAFDAHLRPGGTLAISCMGEPCYDDSRVRKIWEKMYPAANEKIWISQRVKEGEAGRKGLKGTATISTGYDTIALPGEVFDSESVVRYKVNSSQDWWWDSHVPPNRKELIAEFGGSQVKPKEKVVEEQQEGWDFEVDLQGMKDQAGSLPVWGDGKDYEGYWEELKQIVGDGKVKGWWPHVLILATKQV